MSAGDYSPTARKGSSTFRVALIEAPSGMSQPRRSGGGELRHLLVNCPGSASSAATRAVGSFQPRSVGVTRPIAVVRTGLRDVLRVVRLIVARRWRNGRFGPWTVLDRPTNFWSEKEPRRSRFARSRVGPSKLRLAVGARVVGIGRRVRTRTRRERRRPPSRAPASGWRPAARRCRRGCRGQRAARRRPVCKRVTRRIGDRTAPDLAADPPPHLPAGSLPRRPLSGAAVAEERFLSIVGVNCLGSRAGDGGGLRVGPRARHPHPHRRPRRPRLRRNRRARSGCSGRASLGAAACSHERSPNSERVQHRQKPLTHSGAGKGSQPLACSLRVSCSAS